MEENHQGKTSKLKSAEHKSRLLLAEPSNEKEAQKESNRLQQPAKSRPGSLETLLHPIKTVKFVRTLLADPRISIVRKAKFCLGTGGLLIWLFLEAALVAAILVLILYAFHFLINVAITITVGILLFIGIGIGSYLMLFTRLSPALFRNFPDHLRAAYYQWIFQSQEKPTFLKATQDKDWVFKKNSGLLVPSKSWLTPERKDKRKRRKSLDKFFKTCSTPLSILIAAGTLLFSVYQFNAQQTANVRMQATQEAASAQMQATQEAASTAQTLDQEAQATLVGYLDEMSNLLLMDHLKTNPDAQAIAEARTLTAVRNLDGTRKGTLVRFLWEAGLIKSPHPIISLDGADLTNINLSNATLSGADLSGAILTRATLSGATLNRAYLYLTNLSNATLSGATLSGADLSNAILTKATLSRATLSGADLWGATLSQADLSQANLSYASFLLGADLSYAFLLGADLRGAVLSTATLVGATLEGADLRGADLSGANLSGALYNTKGIRFFKLLILPTQWPQGFNPKEAGLVVCQDLCGAIAPQD